MWSKISFVEGPANTLRCLQVELHRKKTGHVQKLRIFPHNSSWVVCPYHAMATMIVCSNQHDNAMFGHIGNASKYVNDLLSEMFLANKDNSLDIEEQYQDFLHYTSHGMRHGAAEYGNEHPDIQVQWLIPRGAWSMDQIMTIFNYICGTSKTDARVGRALAGWKNTEEGGVVPGNTK